MYLEPGSMAWHRERQNGIGGSDLAAMFGISRFESPLGLWELKTNRRLYNPGSALARRGTLLEPYVCRRFEEECGVELVSPPQFVRHPAWDEGIRLLANPDRLLGGVYAGWIFEAKTTTLGGWVHQLFDEGRLPPHFVLQLQHYATCLGSPGGVISCLICPAGPIRDPEEECFPLHLQWKRSARLGSFIEESVAAWWSAHIEPDEPPDYDRHPRADELMELLRTEVWLRPFPPPVRS